MLTENSGVKLVRNAIRRAVEAQKQRGLPVTPEAIGGELGMDAAAWMSFALGRDAPPGSPLARAGLDADAVRRRLCQAILLCKREMANEMARNGSCAGIRFLMAHHFGYAEKSADIAADGTDAGVCIVDSLSLKSTEI